MGVQPQREREREREQTAALTCCYVGQQ